MRTLGIGIVLTALPTMLAAQIRTPASKSDLVTLAAATGTARTACNNMNGSIKNSCTQLQAGSLGGPTGKAFESVARCLTKDLQEHDIP